MAKVAPVQSGVFLSLVCCLFYPSLQSAAAATYSLHPPPHTRQLVRLTLVRACRHHRDSVEGEGDGHWRPLPLLKPPGMLCPPPKTRPPASLPPPQTPNLTSGLQPPPHTPELRPAAPPPHARPSSASLSLPAPHLTSSLPHTPGPPLLLAAPTPWPQLTPNGPRPFHPVPTI